MSRVLRILLLSCLLRAAPLPAATKSTARPRPVSDAELEQEIRARFAKSKAAVNGFTVRVQGGVATIEGTTSVIQHKGAATRMAKSAGAKSVRNLVRISEAARERAAKNLESGRRRVQQKRSESPRSPPEPAKDEPRSEPAARPRTAVVRR